MLIGETYFSNFQVRSTPDAPWERHLPAMPPTALTRWSLSPAFDALARDLERPLTRVRERVDPWQDVEAEAAGLVRSNRYRGARIPRVSFASATSRSGSIRSRG